MFQYVVAIEKSIIKQVIYFGLEAILNIQLPIIEETE